MYIHFYYLFFKGHDKLKPFGFPIHGGIDGYSRKVLWLEVVKSNNAPDVPAHLYLETVKQLKGCHAWHFFSKNVQFAKVCHLFCPAVNLIKVCK